MTTTRECPRCGGRITDRTMCQSCLDTLTRHLDTLNDTLNELDTQLARLSARSTGNGSPAAEHPLMYDHAASEVHDMVRTVLVGWTRDLHKRGTPIPTTTDDRALAEHLRWADWTNHPTAHEFADELQYAIDQVHHCIDTTAPRHYLGPCGSITEDGTTCQGDVYQRGNHMPRCLNCKATHHTDERMAWIADLATDQLVTATTAAGALSAWGQHITPDLIRKWATRGRLLPRGHDRAGHIVYAFGECRALALTSVRTRHADNKHA